jgi:hypothetical protein
MVQSKTRGLGVQRRSARERPFDRYRFFVGARRVTWFGNPFDGRCGDMGGAATLASQPGQGVANGHSGEPCVEIATSIELVDLSPCGVERILERFLGILDAQIVMQGGANLTSPASFQIANGRCIACAEALYEILIGVLGMSHWWLYLYSNLLSKQAKRLYTQCMSRVISRTLLAVEPFGLEPIIIRTGILSLSPIQAFCCSDGYVYAALGDVDFQYNVHLARLLYAEGIGGRTMARCEAGDAIWLSLESYYLSEMHMLAILDLWQDLDNTADHAEHRWGHRHTIDEVRQAM